MVKRLASTSGEEKSCRGVALVEFAMILPLLLILVFGIMDFGFVIYDKAVITNASREAARSGIVYRSNPGDGSYSPLSNTAIETIVNNYVGSRLINFSGNTVSVNITPAEGARVESYRGQPLTVRLNYTYDFLVLPEFTGVPNTINIGAETIMRME